MSDTMYVRTTDADWVARNGGTYGCDGIAIIPVDKVTVTTFGGKGLLQYTFPTRPRDCCTNAMAWPVMFIPKAYSAA